MSYSAVSGREPKSPYMTWDMNDLKFLASMISIKNEHSFIGLQFVFHLHLHVQPSRDKQTDKRVGMKKGQDARMNEVDVCFTSTSTLAFFLAFTLGSSLPCFLEPKLDSFLFLFRWITTASSSSLSASSAKFGHMYTFLEYAYPSRHT